MEVAKESIEAIDPELANIDVCRIRDILSDELMGPRSVPSLVLLIIN
jgi:hypothetical protein